MDRRIVVALVVRYNLRLVLEYITIPFYVLMDPDLLGYVLQSVQSLILTLSNILNQSSIWIMKLFAGHFPMDQGPSTDRWNPDPLKLLRH